MKETAFVKHALKKLDFVSEQFYHLLLVVGPTDNGQKNILSHIAKKIDSPLININLEVSRRLLEMPKKQWPIKAARVVESIIEDKNKSTSILKNIELLFDEALKIDPLRLLKRIARNHTLVVGWCGKIDGKYLTYAGPGHRDYKKYTTKDLTILDYHAPHGSFKEFQ